MEFYVIRTNLGIYLFSVNQKKRIKDKLQELKDKKINYKINCLQQNELGCFISNLSNKVI